MRNEIGKGPTKKSLGRVFFCKKEGTCGYFR